jgi:predicted transcriptional regulator
MEVITNAMTLDDRRRLAGLSVAELSRRSGVGYDRTWRALVGSKLEAKELRRIEAVVASAERERTVRFAAV